MINEACRQGAVWRNMGLDLYVSVNLPPVFWQPTAMRTVLETIESFGLSPDRMMVELTESAVMQNHRASEPIIAELHERGLRLAIDDFGTGHSSLGAAASDGGDHAQDRPLVHLRPARTTTAPTCWCRP